LSLWRHLNPLRVFTPVKAWWSASKARRDCRAWAELVRDMEGLDAATAASLSRPDQIVSASRALTPQERDTGLDDLRRRCEALAAKGRDLKKYRLWLELNANLDSAVAAGAGSADDDGDADPGAR
jgi:hypothetical protein